MIEPSLPTLDLPSALTLLGDEVSRRVVEALDGTGLRHGHGYVVQRLVIGPAAATEIAGELGITQQAVSKAIQELVELGHVALVVDPADRRRRPAQLTERGRAAVEAARTARREIDDLLRAAWGDLEFDRTLRSLTTALETLGLAEKVARRAVPPPGPDLG